MPQEKDKNANRVEQFPNHVGLYHRLRNIRQQQADAVNRELGGNRKKKKKK